MKLVFSEFSQVKVSVSYIRHVPHLRVQAEDHQGLSHRGPDVRIGSSQATSPLGATPNPRSLRHDLLHTDARCYRVLHTAGRSSRSSAQTWEMATGTVASSTVLPLSTLYLGACHRTLNTRRSVFSCSLRLVNTCEYLASEGPASNSRNADQM